MAVIADMLFTVAVVTLAPGAVAEFQFRIAHIGSAADGTPVGVICLGRFFALGLGGFKTDHLVSYRCLLPHFFLYLVPPGRRQHIYHILTKEQEVVCQTDDREQIVGEGINQKIHQYNGQIKQGKDPGLHRNDEEEQELCIREEGCVA